MSETTARDTAKDTIAIGAGTMAHDLVAAMLAELRGMPDHWSRLNNDLQQKIIERLKEKTRDAVNSAVTILMRSEFQAVPAKLDSIHRKDGIRANITVNGDAVCRHALFDAAGAQVLVVIADPKRWTERMDEIRAKDDQLELFDPAANYDPAVDQPGYRRDQDPLAPAKSWADLKKSFGVGEGTAPPPAEGEAEAAAERQKRYNAAFLEVFGREFDSLTEEEKASTEVLEAHNKVVEKLGLGEKVATASEDNATLVAQRILQEQLAEAGVAVSLGAVQAASEAEQNAAKAWVETYLAVGPECTVERPAWLPAPQDDSDE